MVFQEGSLGIGLKQDEFNFAAVSVVADGGQGGKGGVKSGDVVAAVDGEISSTFQAAMALIQAKPRPLTISFHREPDEDKK